MLCEADHGEKTFGHRFSLVARHTLAAWAELDVLLHRVPWEEGVFLEHDAAVGAGAVDQRSVDHNAP